MSATSTVTALKETIHIKECLIRSYESRLAEHTKNVDKLIAAVTAAENALAAEYEFVGAAPSKIKLLTQEIALARKEIDVVGVQPIVNRVAKMQAKMAEMLANMSPEELAELNRLQAE